MLKPWDIGIAGVHRLEDSRDLESTAEETSMEREIVHFEDQIRRLSAQSRRQQVWLVAISIALGVMGLAAARDPKPEVVRARRFEAIDEGGNVRAVLTSEWASGEPGIVLLDERGEQFASLGMTEMTPPVETRQTRRGKAVVFQLTAKDQPDEHVGATTLVATARGGALNVNRGDHQGTKDSIALGISEMEMGLRVEHEENPLIEINVAGDKPTMQLRDSEGKSLLRAP